MKQSTRIKQLFQIPSYRTRLGLFLTIGGLLLLISLFAPLDPTWQNVGTNIATTFIGVGLISYLWDFLGGDPIEVKVAEGFDELGLQLGSIKPTMKLLSDVSEHNIGIARIWSTRREWEKDPTDGLPIWKERVCRAKQVDIVSNTFYSLWAKDDGFWEELFDSVNRGTKFRLLIYDPDSDILQIRSENEDDTKLEKTSEMKMEIYSTLKKIAKKISSLDNNTKHNLEVRLNSKYYQLAQIIRADNQILVALYLSHKTGSTSPTFQIAGPDSSFFETYTQQFETLWTTGKIFSTKDIQKFLSSR